MKRLIKGMHDKGVTLVAGTDMGFPGYSVARELELYVQAGLTPIQAIRTATLVPAIVMKRDRQTGSVEVGKVADLVIIDGNPIKNISEIRKVKLVIKGGQIYSPDELYKLAGFNR
jgi:imidazolonepropionase-like amidohydrolase